MLASRYLSLCVQESYYQHCQNPSQSLHPASRDIYFTSYSCTASIMLFVYLIQEAFLSTYPGERLFGNKTHCNLISVQRKIMHPFRYHQLHTFSKLGKDI